jgi:hypothetical protein
MLHGGARVSIRYRLMRPQDITICVKIVAEHPILGPRYGSAIEQLHAAWLKVLGTEAFHACVFEEIEGSKVRLLGVATNSSVRQVREANSVVGLNIMVWPSCLLPDEQKRTEVNHAVMASFMEHHQGYLLKELIVQATNSEEVEVMLNMGGLFMGTDDGRYVGSLGRPTHEVLAQPHFFGVTRELALQRMGTWVSAVFAYRRPWLGFSASEQRLLVAALKGGTDQELSDELAISLSAVKKAWCSIHNRAAQQRPESAPDHRSHCEIDHFENLNGDRGKQQKQRLLAYLREHPEELRPYSRRRAQEKSFVSI